MAARAFRESLRSYLLTKFKQVVGSYGASDLEVNMAIETELPFACAARCSPTRGRRASAERTDYGVTPMIFQYNPLAYPLETNDKSELVVTISRPYNIAPKIRYNIHDRGHVLMYGALKDKLAAASRRDLLDGGEPKSICRCCSYTAAPTCPSSITRQVTPDSIREILYGVKELTPILNTFRLLSYEDDTHNKRIEIAAELVKSATPPTDTAALADAVFRKLGEMNAISTTPCIAPRHPITCRA